jgi:hypothetical protein
MARMPTRPKTSNGAIAVAAALAVSCILCWMFLLPGLTELANSDAAGNGLSQALAAFLALALWTLLALLAFLTWATGGMPTLPAIAALVLVPVSGVATLAALELLAAPNEPPFLWPIIVPAGAPPLVIAFCLWSVIPRWRARIPAVAASGVVWGGVLALCLSVGVMDSIRSAARQHEAAALDKWRAELAAVPANAPLWEWTRFLGKGVYDEGEVVNTIRRLDRRQAEAEIMLERGDFPFGYLGRFDLDPTPAICEKARALLRRRVEPLIAKTPNSRPYADVAYQVAGALYAMQWLVGYDCPCNEESLAWESMANGYRDPNFDVVELARLRDPKKLGRTLREYPEKFSMLTPKAHLKAWLRFAEDREYHDAALAGARRLDHRTADAVEMLEDKNSEPGNFYLMRMIPELDLEATPRLCQGALALVRADLSQIYRPSADNPMPYDELLERLGEGRPLTALQWLAGHGCDAEAELTEAEAVVRTYQDSLFRSVMLSSLEELRHKP